MAAASIFHAMHHAPCSLLLNESVQFLHRALQDHPLRFFENFISSFWKETVAQSLPSIVLEILCPELQLLLVHHLPMLCSLDAATEFLGGNLVLDPVLQKFNQAEPLHPSSNAKEVGWGEQQSSVDTMERFVNCIKLLGCEAEAS